MSLQEELVGPPPAKLVVDNVSKWFRTTRQTVHALDHVSLTIGEGEFVCLVGPSGCGKSTLLNIISGLETPDEGVVMADNEPVLNPGRHRLVMFQESALFPWLDVTGNVMFGLKLKPGLTNKERLEVAKFFLQLVGLGKIFGRACARAFGRDETTRRAGACAGAESACLADGRTVRGPGCAYARATLQRHPGDLAETTEDDRLRHP